MKKNVGQVDRVLRIVVGIILILFFISDTSNWWGLLGIIPLATSFIAFCPLYTFLKVNTAVKEEKK